METPKWSFAEVVGRGVEKDNEKEAKGQLIESECTVERRTGYTAY